MVLGHSTEPDKMWRWQGCGRMGIGRVLTSWLGSTGRSRVRESRYVQGWVAINYQSVNHRVSHGILHSFGGEDI